MAAMSAGQDTDAVLSAMGFGEQELATLKAPALFSTEYTVFEDRYHE